MVAEAAGPERVGAATGLAITFVGASIALSPPFYGLVADLGSARRRARRRVRPGGGHPGMTVASFPNLVPRRLRNQVRDLAFRAPSRPRSSRSAYRRRPRGGR